MSFSFLSILDPLPSLYTKSDTTLAIMKECLKMGIAPYACELKDIFLKDNLVHFSCALVAFDSTGKPFYKEAKKPMSSKDFPIILMRKDPPIDENFISALLLLRHHDKDKTKVINDPESLLFANEKLFGLSKFPQFFPNTFIASHCETLFNAAKEMGDFVLKPLYRCGGGGVFVFNKDDKNLASCLEVLTNGFTSPVIIQEYIKNAPLGDKRIFLLGGEILGCLVRRPKKNDHRANCHVGGTVFKTEVTKEEMKIVEELKPCLLNYGLHLVGIDVIDGKLTEINITSPTCVVEIGELMGENLTYRIVNYLKGII